MDSKKLPVLWVSAPNLLEDMEAGHGNAIASLEPRGRKPSEPYIPVARVRELIALYEVRGDIPGYAKEKMERDLQRLIADVEES